MRNPNQHIINRIAALESLSGQMQKEAIAIRKSLESFYSPAPLGVSSKKAAIINIEAGKMISKLRNSVAKKIAKTEAAKTK